LKERVNIRKELQNRILILDGDMGTMIQQYHLEEKDFRSKRFEDHPVDVQGNNDLLSLTQPKIIQEIHEKYLEAGADIIETNTFSSTSIAQADYKMQHLAYELNREAAKIAKQAASVFTDKPRFVAGSMGPTNKTASISPDVSNPGYRAVTFDQLAEAYKTQARGLMEGGAEERDEKLPIMVSGTITDASGRTLSGQTPEAFLISLSHAELLSIGLNCALGAKQLRPYLKTLADHSDVFISAYPNAGLPNEFGEYDQSAQQMADEVKWYLEEGLVNILGGCCGTTPRHIRLMAQLAATYQPRPIAEVV